MREYILANPGYWVLLLVNVMVLVRVLMFIDDKGRNPGGDDDDNGGGNDPNLDPVLDLPPGVSLPVDTPEKEPV